MQTPSFASLVASLTVSLAASTTACTPDSADPIAAPDASPPPRALDPAGTYALTSTFTLAAPPPDLAPLLAELAIATDGPDDPTAYLVDLVVGALPEGNARTVASVLAPYVATQLHDRIATYAPELAPALREMAVGATRIATRFSTLETLVVSGTTIDQDAVARGRASRRLRGVRIDNTDIAFSSIGLADPSVDAELAVELVGTATRAEEPRALSNRVVIARHAVALPIGAWFRAAFDRAAVPAVVPGATDLATALRALVDCPRLGGLVADAVGIGSAALYAQACSIGIGVAAREIYERFPAASAPPHELAIMGVARAMDRDGDGIMDAIDAGVWTGTLGDISVGTSVFEGTSR